jgi:hypothetical protein
MTVMLLLFLSMGYGKPTTSIQRLQVILKYGIKITRKKSGLFLENIGKRLSIDEPTCPNGELYTILTNKAAKERIYSSYDCWNQLLSVSYYRKKPLKTK